jgi:hypothetical protein
MLCWTTDRPEGIARQILAAASNNDAGQHGWTEEAGEDKREAKELIVVFGDGHLVVRLQWVHCTTLFME